MQRGTLAAAVLLASCAYRTSVWVTPADTESLTANVARLTEINPVWYSLDPNGAVVRRVNAEDPALRRAMAGRRVMPTIQNSIDGRFDADVLCAVIGERASRRRHVDAIVRLVENFDGIDVDYEAMPSNMREDFSAFITDLAAALHQRGKRLSVTLHAKTSDASNWPGPGGEDWRLIGREADAVKIMCYDFHWSSSGPGPLAPLDWLEKIARYAAATIPSRKQFYGLPWYGYDWQGKSGRGISFSAAMQLAEFNVAQVQRDANGELHFTFEDHEVWFQDLTSYRIKVATLLRGRPWIGGVAGWRAGSEETRHWVEGGGVQRRDR